LAGRLIEIWYLFVGAMLSDKMFGFKWMDSNHQFRLSIYQTSTAITTDNCWFFSSLDEIFSSRAEWRIQKRNHFGLQKVVRAFFHWPRTEISMMD